MRVKRMESGIGLPNEAKLLHFRKRKWQNVKNITRSIPPTLWALEWIEWHLASYIGLQPRKTINCLQGGLSTPGDPFQDSQPDHIENKYYTVTSCDNFNFSIEGPSLPANRWVEAFFLCFALRNCSLLILSVYNRGLMAQSKGWVKYRLCSLQSRSYRYYLGYKTIGGKGDPYCPSTRA